jgi:uncharacterized Zn finger protein
MIAITCEKCRRRFTPPVEQIQAELVTAQGRKHALISCPHCGKGNKIAPERLREAVRFAPNAPIPPSSADQPE